MQEAPLTSSDTLLDEKEKVDIPAAKNFSLQGLTDLESPKLVGLERS